MPLSDVLASMMVFWSNTRIASRLGLPGRRRKDFAAFRRVRRRVHAEERAYNSLIVAKKSSTAMLVSWLVRGGGGTRLVDVCFEVGAGGSPGVMEESVIFRDREACVVGAVLMDVRKALLSSLETDGRDDPCEKL